METGKAAYVAVEVKLLRDYFSLARGIGQAIINSAKYQYGIVFALDLRRPNEKHEFDDGLCASLWNNYRIRIIIGQ